MTHQKVDDLRDRTVPNSQPDNLGWLTIKQAPLLKIRVLGDDRQSLLPGICLNRLIGPAKQTAIAHVGTAGKVRCQQSD